MKKKTKELINAVIDTPNLPSHLYEAAWAAFHEESKPRGRKPLEPEKLWELIDYLEERIGKGLSIHAAAEAAASETTTRLISNRLIKSQSFPLTVRQIESLYAKTPQFRPCLK
jgi:hypothetical protein